LAVSDAVVLLVALWYWGFSGLMVIKGVDRSTEAKGDTETEGCS
jgi:hypothetical protein